MSDKQVITFPLRGQTEQSEGAQQNPNVRPTNQLSVAQPQVPMNMQDSDFIIDMGLVELPTEGMFYPDKNKTLNVQVMTANDENILVSPAQLRAGTHIDTLIKHKVKEPGFNVDILMPGDKMAIIIYLRKTGYGADYQVGVTDPVTRDEFEAVVDLELLQTKPIRFRPDENLEFSFTLPIKKKVVKFRMLNAKEQILLLAEIEKKAIRNRDGISPSVTETLRWKIMEIDGKRDKMWISRYIDVMNPRDSHELRFFMDEVEPGLDLNYLFQNPNTGREFLAEVPLGLRLLYPSYGL